MWTLRQITQKVKEVNDIYANATANVIRIVRFFINFYDKNHSVSLDSNLKILLSLLLVILQLFVKGLEITDLDYKIFNITMYDICTKRLRKYNSQWSNHRIS